MIDALRTGFGVVRSLAIYYGRPGQGAALARLYGQFLGPGDLAFDIGAHVGNRTRAMARAGARVVAVEPQAAFQPILRRLLPRGAVLEPVAVGAVPGEARLRVSRLHPTVTTLAPDFAATVGPTPGFRRVAWDAHQVVPVTTLDRLIATHGQPRFVKIDVEGHEAAVLAGLSAPLPALAFEYLPAALPVAHRAIDRLAALGRYRFNLAQGEMAMLALGDWLDPATFRQVLDRIAADGRPGDIYARLEGDAR